MHAGSTGTVKQDILKIKNANNATVSKITFFRCSTKDVQYCVDARIQFTVSRPKRQ